jgi:hypothetical protein
MAVFKDIENNRLGPVSQINVVGVLDAPYNSSLSRLGNVNKQIDTRISLSFSQVGFAFGTIFLYPTMRIGNYNIWKKLDVKLFQNQRETQRRLLEVGRTMENVHCL